MTLQIVLPPSLEDRLRREAEHQGISADAVAVKLLDEYLPLHDRTADTVAILQTWIDEDADESDEAYDLFQALDEARTSDRKLFPDELKGMSW